MEEIEMNTTQKRPTGLLVLCILTFINSGLSFLGNIIVFLSHKFIMSNMENIVDIYANNELYASMQTSLDQMLSMPKPYFLFIAIAAFLAVLGAAMMLKLKKIGFHFYVIAQILVIAIPIIMLGFNGASLFSGLVFSGIFVILYSRYLKIMK